jgi:hypothetical protein
MFARSLLHPFLAIFAPASTAIESQRRPAVTYSRLKRQLIAIVDDEQDEWEVLLADVAPDRVDEPGVAGDWSFRDVVAHLFAWRDGSLRLLEAEARGEPEPPPPWPGSLTTDEAIGAWLHERDRDLPASAVLAAYLDTFARLRAAVLALPDDALTDPDYFPWMNGESVAASMLDRSWFDHLHVEHEPDLRRWIASQPRPGDR